MSDANTQNSTPEATTAAPVSPVSTPAETSPAVTPAAPAKKPAARKTVDPMEIVDDLNKQISTDTLPEFLTKEEISFFTDLMSRTGDDTFMDMFGNDDGVSVTLPDGTVLRDYQQALEETKVKIPTPTARAAVRRVKSITENIQKLRDARVKAESQITRAANIAIRKQRGGKEFLELEALSMAARELVSLANPAGLYSRVAKRTDIGKGKIRLYLVGTAVAPVESNQTPEQAAFGLIPRMQNHVSELVRATGVKENSISRSTKPVPGKYKDGQVTALVEYEFALGSINQLRMVLEALDANGPLPVLDTDPDITTQELLDYQDWVSAGEPEPVETEPVETTAEPHEQESVYAAI